MGIKSRRPRRIGIFGGSFDPIHNGHLCIARNAQKQMRLDVVLFIPSWLSPLKPRGHAGHARHRLAMVRHAIGRHSTWKVDATEVRRKGISYTIQTIRAMVRKYRNSRIFLIIGSDNLSSFDRWRKPEEIAKMCTVLVYRRSRHRVSRRSLRRWNALPLNGPMLPETSTEVRRRLSNHRPITDLVPAPVAEYVDRHDLYVA